MTRGPQGLDAEVGSWPQTGSMARVRTSLIAPVSADEVLEHLAHCASVAESGSLTSHDSITVRETLTGTEVSHDAPLTRHGAGRLLDWPLNRTFPIIGRRAGVGLRAELASLPATRAGGPE